MKKKSKYHIYAISGLGLDSELFLKLNLNFPLHHINWIEPLKNENIQLYAARLCKQIKERENLVLIGLSFGGIMAHEITKLLSVKKLILISSIKSSIEKPFLFRFFNKIPLYKFSEKKGREITYKIWAPLFGAYTKEEQKYLVLKLRSFSDYYHQWSVQQIADWSSGEPNTEFIHIHGTNDKIFPIKNIEKPIIIPNGNHAAIFKFPVEISNIINQFVY